MTTQSHLAPGDDPALARAGLRHAPVPTAVLGPGGIATASASFAERVGVALGELTGRRLADLTIQSRDGGERMDGLSLLTAATGEQGVAPAAEHRARLVLLDLNLADIGDEEVPRRLPANRATESIPVIVVSADATPARVAQLEPQGVVAYLTKPLDVPGFMWIVRTVTGRS